MGVIKIGSSTNQKGITVNPQTVLFNGNSVKKIIHNSNNVIWRLAQALISTMTSNTTPSGVVSASNNDSNAWKAFDSDLSTWWYTALSVPTGWLQYKFDIAKVVTKIELANYNYSGGYRLKTFKLQGSNDGSAFIDLTEVLTLPADSEKHSFYVNNGTAYQYYRIKMISNYAGSSNASGLAELQLYGE